jgi:phospholipase C
VTRTRVRLAAGLALTMMAVTVAPGLAPTGASAATPVAKPKTRTPIQHVVTVMQEGHTFDNYFGSYPGAEGIPANTCVPVSPPAPQPCVKPFSLGSRPLRDLTRGEPAVETAQAKGAMNGFVKAQSRNGVIEDQAMGKYDREGVPYYWNLANSYVLYDHFFASAPGGSVPNHVAWVAGKAAGKVADTIPATGFGNIPNIFDQLEKQGISWKFYVQNYDPTVTFRRAPGTARGAQVVRVPLLAYARFVDDPKLFSHIVPVSQYFDDLARGTLPAVSYIVPSGPSERPPTNVASGARFTQSLISALAMSSSWSASAFLLTYDGWGGYYDHVAPTGTGFRVPTLLVSAYARKGYVDHTPLETASVPRFIEENWGLPQIAGPPPIASLSSAFDFQSAPRRAEAISAATAPAPIATARTSVVFVLYGLALVGALTVLGVVTWRARRRPSMVLS